MTDIAKLLFGSIIAYGVVFIVALLAAGIALDRPATVIAAVMVAGGSYLTQVVGSWAAAFPYGAPGWLTSLSIALWAATVMIAIVGLWFLIGA